MLCFDGETQVVEVSSALSPKASAQFLNSCLTFLRTTNCYKEIKYEYKGENGYWVASRVYWLVLWLHLVHSWPPEPYSVHQEPGPLQTSVSRLFYQVASSWIWLIGGTMGDCRWGQSHWLCCWWHLSGRIWLSGPVFFGSSTSGRGGFCCFVGSELRSCVTAVPTGFWWFRQG